MNLAFTIDKEFVHRLTEIVLANLESENFGVDELAAETKLPSAQIRRRLKLTTGQNIAQFIRTVRLQKAMEMLQQQNVTASEVAFKVGFGSPAYFSKCFHEHFGFSPGEVKKRDFETGATDNPETVSREKLSQPVVQAKVERPLYFNFRSIFIASLSIVAVLILVYSLFPRFGQQKSGNAPVAPKSIAVLPVQNLTGNPGFDHIAEGIQTSMTDEVYKLGNLVVRPSHASMKLTGNQLSVREMVDKLNVDIYLKPSLLCSGDSFCISVQLFRVGPEEQMLWSNTFIQDKGNVFAIFKNSAWNIAEKINLQLSAVQSSSYSVSPSVNPDFFNSLMLGKHLVDKGTPEEFEKGVQELKKAADMDPLNPLTYLALAVGYSNSGHVSAAGADASKISVAYAQKALQLDSTLAEAHTMLATWYLYQVWDWQKAGHHLKKAIALNPNIPAARYTNGWYQAMLGNLAEAEKEMKMAVEIDPLDPICIGYLGWLYLYAKKWDKALNAADRTLEIEPDYTMGFFVKGCALAELGKHAEAIEVHKKGVAIRRGFQCGLGLAYALAGQKEDALKIAVELEKKTNAWNTWGLSLIYAALKDKEKTLQRIEEMYTLRMDFTPWIYRDPNMKFLSGDKRFKEIVRRLNLPS